MSKPSTPVEQAGEPRASTRAYEATTTTVRLIPHQSPILQLLERGALPILTVLVYLFFTSIPPRAPRSPRWQTSTSSSAARPL